MVKKGVFTKVLAVFGTALVWFPILVTVGFFLLDWIVRRSLRFDFLMPAELFPAAFAGMGLLLWAALRAHSRRRLIAWGFASAVGFLVGGQTFAVVTGLASGETEPVGWRLTLIIATIAGYSLALIELEAAGVLLLSDLFRRNKKDSVSPVAAL